MLNLGEHIWQIVSALVIAVVGGLLAVWIDRLSKQIIRICIIGFCVVLILVVILLPKEGVEPPVVRGLVTAGGEPVAGAAIELDGRSTASDTRGEYIILDAPPGRKTIRAWRGLVHVDGFIDVPIRGIKIYDFVFP